MCEKHFVSGRAAIRTGISLILTGFQLCFWETKKLQIEQIIKKRRRNEVRERESARELVCEPTFEKREKELELERAAKRQKLNEPGQEVSDLSFEGNKIK